MKKIQFLNTLSTLAKVLEDEQFLDQMCKINDDIYKLGVDENNNNEGINNYNLSGWFNIHIIIWLIFVYVFQS